MLLLAAGREATALFDSYHPFTSKPGRILETYYIGDLTGEPEFPTYKPDSGFWKDLTKEVGDYFETNKLDYKNPVPGLVRMAFVIPTAFLGYAISMGWVWPSVFAPIGTWAGFAIAAIAAIVFGICQALPLLHVMHDASHVAIGHGETWWKAIGRISMEWYAGASMMSWHHQHVVGHHIYTNVVEADPDLPVSMSGDIRRLVPRQAWAALYKYQHIYLPIIYGVLALRFRVQDYTDTYAMRTNGPVRVNYYDNAWIRLHAVKAVWLTWRLAIPLWLSPQSALAVIALFLIADITTGYWLAWNFQVSHVSDAADWPNGGKALDAIADEWAVSQVRTGVNYALDSPVQTFLCGALNYQIEHHLLPCVSQYHYPAIAPIVQRVCKKYGVPYNNLPSYWAAWKAHVNHLYTLGQQGKAAHMD
jgi:fatty acid desaturase